MEFRLYPLKDTARLEELCRLFALGLADTEPELWLWKHYRENGLPEGMVLVAEDQDGKLRGMFAMQPAWYRCGSQRRLLVQLEDLVIDPECRGQGLMRKLYDYTVEYFRTRGASALIALSTNDASYPILCKYGCRDLGKLRVMCTPKAMVPKFWKRRSYDRDGWQIALQNSAPEELVFAYDVNRFKMEKNLRFAQWKFDENPERKSRWLTIRKNGELIGSVTFYVNQGRLRSAVNIQDFELKNCVTDDILKKVVNILHSFGHWVSLWGSWDDVMIAQWQRAGLTLSGDCNDHFIYHSLDGIPAPAQWYITKADSDN